MMHSRLTLVIAAMMAIALTSVFAQNRSSLTPEEQLESKRHYIDAARRYSAQPQLPENALKAGMNYYRAGRSDLALGYLRKADSLGQLKSAEDRFAYFQCLKSARKYREADGFISAAASGSPDTLLVMNANRLAYYDKVLSYSGSKLNEIAMNTEFSEFGPAVFNGVLYFNSTRPAVSNKQVHRLNMQPFYNLYGVSAENPADAAFQPMGSFGVAEQQVMVNGQSVGVLPAGINQKYHDGPVFVTPSGKHMFFTSNWDGKKRHHNNTRIRLKLYHSVRENGQWGTPQSLPFNGTSWSSQHAVFDEETSVLYFSSNMPGGRGGFDIWTARLEDGKWSEAQNLGKNVNTPGNEVFPMLTRDGGLLFSSNGWPGLGGLDIFLSDDPARPSINLLAGVNSEADDFEMLFTGTEKGYIVTNRAGGKGDDDIWSFKANLNDIRMENGVPVPVGVNLSYKGGMRPATVNVEVKDGEQVRLTDGPATGATATIEAVEGSQITATAPGFEPATAKVERGTIGNGDLALTLEPSMGSGSGTGTTGSASSSDPSTSITSGAGTATGTSASGTSGSGAAGSTGSSGASGTSGSSTSATKGAGTATGTSASGTSGSGAAGSTGSSGASGTSGSSTSATSGTGAEAGSSASGTFGFPASSTAGSVSATGNGAGASNGSYTENFEDRSFAGLQGKLNGGEAVLSNSNDKDYNVTLADGQQLITNEAGFAAGTYGTAARAVGNSSAQVLEAMHYPSGKPAYRMEVSPDGSAREGWSLSSNGQLIASGKEVPARTGEWYDMKMVVRPDSVLASINGKTVGGGKNPQVGVSAGPMSVSSLGGSQFDDLSYQPLGRVPRVGSGEVALLPAYPGDGQVAESVRTGAGITGSLAVGESGEVLAGALEQIRREQPGYEEALQKATGAGVTPVKGNSKYDETMPFNYQGKTFLSTNRPVSGAGAGSANGGNVDAGRGTTGTGSAAVAGSLNNSTAGTTGGANVGNTVGVGTDASAGSGSVTANSDNAAANGNSASMASTTGAGTSSARVISGDAGLGAPYRLAAFTADGKPLWASGSFDAASNASDPSNVARIMLPAGTDGAGYAAPVSVSSGGNWMVLNDGKGNMSWSLLDGNVWSTPTPYTHNGALAGAGADVKANNREGYFDEKTSTLYFSSNRVGGFGGYDLWKSVWNGKSWSAPQNAGPMVNSAGDEVTPFVTGNGNLMYSSNGWSGLGGQDVYLWKGGMNGPVNMLKGVNSASDDIAARVNDDGSGHVSSNRPGGKGGFDVYQFKVDLEKTIAANKSIAPAGQGAAGSDNNVIPFGTVVGQLEGAGDSGEWMDLEIAEPEGSAVGKAYRLVNGRLVTAKAVDRRDKAIRKVTVRGRDRKGKVITRVVEVWPAPAENSADLVVTLYFASGRLGYRQSSFADANRVAQMLRSDPSLKIRIDVYTDCVGSEAGNQAMSERRAGWLKGHFTKRVPGSEDRIEAEGHGETNPVSGCSCEPGQSICSRKQNNLNRRAEIRLLR